tara:strand:+ start:328 stop:546 length:219 start_codon:yes stop_codon:yes gene_type:complete
MKLYKTQVTLYGGSILELSMLGELNKSDVNVLEVALTHLIEELKDEINLQEQLDSAKAMYLALGNKPFWGDK